MSPEPIMQAGELCVEHIGELIRVREYDSASEIVTITTGELRQISHSNEHTVIHVGMGAAKEILMISDQPVSIRPPADYHDYEDLQAYGYGNEG